MLGPWRDDHAHTFIRISFKFPRDYWKSKESLPSFDLDKIAGISLKTRAYLLKKLRNIRIQRRPCLEPWLRFLLGEDDGEFPYAGGMVVQEGPTWNPEDEDPVGVNGALNGDHGKNGDDIVIRNTPANRIRPRRCQGVFGPNGKPGGSHRRSFLYSSIPLRGARLFLFDVTNQDTLQRRAQTRFAVSISGIAWRLDPCDVPAIHGRGRTTHTCHAGSH